MKRPSADAQTGLICAPRLVLANKPPATPSGGVAFGPCEVARLL